MPRIDFPWVYRLPMLWAGSRCPASTSCINEVFSEGVDATHRPLETVRGFMQEVDATHRLPP